MPDKPGRPAYKWRLLIAAMKPESRYSFEMMRSILANATDSAVHPSVQETRMVIESCGDCVHSDINTGAYSLTQIGITFRERNQ
jgi:hypothetical protein